MTSMTDKIKLNPGAPAIMDGKMASRQGNNGCLPKQKFGGTEKVKPTCTSQEPLGFNRGLSPERILGAIDASEDYMLLTNWKDTGDLNPPFVIFRYEKLNKSTDRGCSSNLELKNPVNHIIEKSNDSKSIKEDKPSGLDRGLSPDKILGATEKCGELMLLIKWKGSDQCDLVSSRQANTICPQFVIPYYEKILRWINEESQIKTLTDSHEADSLQNNVSCIQPEKTDTARDVSRMDLNCIINNKLSENRLIPEHIIGLTECGGELTFLMKFQGIPEQVFVPAKQANVLCPGLVISFYEEKLCWSDATDEVQLEPMENHKCATVTIRDEKASNPNKSNGKQKFSSNGKKAPPQSKKIVEYDEERGFNRGLAPHRIIGAAEKHGELLFLMKWEGSEDADLVLAKKANVLCPELVISFYEKKLLWSNE